MLDVEYIIYIRHNTHIYNICDMIYKKYYMICALYVIYVIIQYRLSVYSVYGR